MKGRTPEEWASRAMGLPRGPEYPNRELHARLAIEIRDAMAQARAEALEEAERAAMEAFGNVRQEQYIMYGPRSYMSAMREAISALAKPEGHTP